jgi:hypothetical protein
VGQSDATTCKNKNWGEKKWHALTADTAKYHSSNGVANETRGVTSGLDRMKRKVAALEKLDADFASLQNKIRRDPL